MENKEEIKSASKDRFAKDKRQMGMIPKEGFMRIAQVLSVFPVSRMTWYNGVKSGIYPPAIKLGKRASAWRVEDIRDLIEKLGKS